MLTAIRGDENFFNFDVTGDLDAGDAIVFRAARKITDLTDANAVIKKTRGQGIVDLVAAQGTFQVQLDTADTASLKDEALVFHCKIFKADVSMDTTVARGILRLTG